jgi:hypothetical protein
MERANGEPWELPGAVRRDVEPDRGPTLLLLGGISLACGLLSLVGFVPSLVAVPLGVAVRVAAGRDLTKMREGQMDPGGQAQTRRASSLASLGAGIGLLALAVYIVVLGWQLVQMLLRL